MRGESARPGKRPLRALSASEKMEAIQRVHEGESKASVARDIGVPESTLRGWCKSEHKIRGMARNSSTPDSEAHSPASSSGANPMTGMAGASNLSSEDEGMGPSSTKKTKLDSLGCDDLSDSKLDNKQPKMDYMSSIINSLVASGVRSENSSILLQQLGLLSSAQSAAHLTKNLLSLSNTGLASSHLGGTTQTVGLVENGLQYTKSSGGSNSNKRSSTSHISAIAPTSQFDSVSKSRKSLPPAAEAPSTPVPASPRKTNEYHNGGSGLQQHQQQLYSSRSSKKDNGSYGSSSSGNSSSTRKMDEALWIWLAQQQQLLGQHAVAFNPSATSVDGSWFWQWYKQCSFPTASTSTAGVSQSQQQHQQQQHQSATPLSRKSPTKAKAMLDNVLCNNNNNENARRSLNLSMCGNNGVGTTEEEDSEAEPEISVAEAIENAERFYEWLIRCSFPTVTRLQIMQFKYMLDSIKTSGTKTRGTKRRRK